MNKFDFAYMRRVCYEYSEEFNRPYFMFPYRFEDGFGLAEYELYGGWMNDVSVSVMEGIN
jgi:hypothetical protein